MKPNLELGGIVRGMVVEIVRLNMIIEKKNIITIEEMNPKEMKLILLQYIAILNVPQEHLFFKLKAKQL